MFKYLFTVLIVACLLFANAQTQPKPKPKPGTAATKPTQKSTGATGAAKAKTAAAKPATAKVSYTINGNLQGYSNHLLVLIKYRAKETVVMDSVRTDAQGNFTLRQTTTSPCLAYLQYSKYTAVPLIIENGSVFNVNINPALSGLNYELTGTKADKSISLYNFIKDFNKLNGELSTLDQQIANEPDAIKSYEMQMSFTMKQKELTTLINNMLTNHSPLEGYFVLFNFMEEQKPSDIKVIMKKMETLKDTKSVYYTDLKSIYDANKTIEIGEMAPDIDLPQTDGKHLKLSSLRGKYVLIDFWASWCGPCRAEFPNVKRIYSKYKSKGFEIYGVSLDRDADAWISSIANLGLEWKHVSDLKYWSSAPAKTYKVSGIPFTVLLDKEGRIIAKNLRGEELERKLEELFP